MKCLGLHNKPKAEVQPGHKLTGPKEEEEEEEEEEEPPYNSVLLEKLIDCQLVNKFPSPPRSEQQAS
jgi:hypothetical protein